MMMGFDPATLLTVSATALVMFALAMLATGGAAQADRRWWIAGFMLGAIGFILMIASPTNAVSLPRDLANIIFMLAYGSCHAGARCLAGRRPLPQVIGGGAVAWLAFTCGLHASAALRMPLASILVCGYGVLIAHELARGVKKEERARRFAAALCLLHAMFFAARAVLGPTLGLATSTPESTLSIWAAILAFETIVFSAGLSTLIVAALRDKETLAHRRLALTDSLTGVGNRHAFEMQARPFVENVRAGEPRPMLVLMDLDRFKAINDRYGHAAGDRLLVDVAKAARHCLPDPDHFWRIGGDEFVALLRGPAAARAPVVAEAIRVAVKRSSLSTKDAISATIGIAPVRAGAVLMEVLKDADQALYAGKERGRDCAVIAGIPRGEATAICTENRDHPRILAVNS